MIQWSAGDGKALVTSCRAAHCAKIHLRRKINAMTMETTADQLKKYQQNETSANPQDLMDLTIWKKHLSYFLFIITFLLNILYFIIPTKNPILTPPKKKGEKNNTSHENSHLLARHHGNPYSPTALFSPLNHLELVFSPLVSRRGTQVWVASRRCLVDGGWNPQQTHGENPTSKMDQPFGWWDWGETHHLRKHPYISYMQIGFRFLESICMIQPR